MQSDPKEIYKLTAERTGKSEQTYKDIGSAVFQALAQGMKRPKTLILKLKGVGQWYLRKKRMEIMINIFPPNYERVSVNAQETLKLENRREIYEIFIERMKEYEEYLQIKREIRKKRNENQTLLGSTDGEAESKEPS